MKLKLKIWLLLAAVVASLALFTGTPGSLPAPGPAATVADDAYPPAGVPPFEG